MSLCAACFKYFWCNIYILATNKECLKGSLYLNGLFSKQCISSAVKTMSKSPCEMQVMERRIPSQEILEYIGPFGQRRSNCPDCHYDEYTTSPWNFLKIKSNRITQMFLFWCLFYFIWNSWMSKISESKHAMKICNFFYFSTFSTYFTTLFFLIV